MIETITNKEDWNFLLSEFDMHDSYHTFEYHLIAKSKGENPILIKYVENDIIIAIPLLIRDIKGSAFKDATSVYGYTGPLSKGINNSFDNSNFINSLNHFFNENNIISVFSRLHPYVPNQTHVLKNFGAIFPMGKVVNINLKLDKTIQRQNYHRRLKNHINRSRKNCSIVKVDSYEGVDKFIEIYNESMDRVNAEKSYYFDKKYYYNLFNSTDFETELLLARDNESKNIISGAIFFKKNGIVQYHLSGTKSDFFHLMPTKLLIDEMRISATDEGYHTFNLGGGLGACEDNSLFRFKSSFSDEYHQFFIWKLIVNEKAYKNICDKNKITNKESNFFPLYRLKVFI
ncbi:peptidoglycan bridge formation glycyltransferase FemA/FemB family protein [Flavivirga spongiicola]|uniref:Peptidoglycan bridge formation glycyltransferase FemA/FemB family protein n=1 Tax=Flavivirga spongiicola TaxID=421621 RepID=A0ABU7XXE6_9FLAO|nr:peptidoglycan bridge formation glycyltransferase FemA/FemB family protein [Flavivirga sp. MEBiC05379]MDO5980470.1 peptidoglycan bridge formation glycyltransferase FemA/FemB family protein [Flavivirga sp. MEBiC05379]